MSEEREKLEGKGQEAMGVGREKVGEMTGDERMEAEGRGDQTEGKAKQMAAGIKDKAGDAADAAKDAVDDVHEKLGH